MREPDDSPNSSPGLDLSADCLACRLLKRSVFPWFFPNMTWLLMSLRASGLGFSTPVDIRKGISAVQEDTSESVDALTRDSLTRLL